MVTCFCPGNLGNASAWSTKPDRFLQRCCDRDCEHRWTVSSIFCSSRPWNLSGSLRGCAMSESLLSCHSTWMFLIVLGIFKLSCCLVRISKPVAAAMPKIAITFRGISAKIPNGGSGRPTKSKSWLKWITFASLRIFMSQPGTQATRAFRTRIDNWHVNCITNQKCT